MQDSVEGLRCLFFFLWVESQQLMSSVGVIQSTWNQSFTFCAFPESRRDVETVASAACQGKNFVGDMSPLPRPHRYASIIAKRAHILFKFKIMFLNFSIPRGPFGRNCSRIVQTDLVKLLLLLLVHFYSSWTDPQRRETGTNWCPCFPTSQIRRSSPKRLGRSSSA